MGYTILLLLHRHLFLFFAVFILSFDSSLIVALGIKTRSERRVNYNGFGRRLMLTFKETLSGSNTTFDCSSSGLCIACLHSEKSDDKYRCSETGYRMPFKCTKIENTSQPQNSKKSPNGRFALEDSYDKKKLHGMLHGAEPCTSGYRNLLDDSPTLYTDPHAYLTYRSCIPPVSEEKLSFLGFEGIVFCLLIVSGLVLYVRRKRTVAAMPGVGAGRIQMNSRF